MEAHVAGAAAGEASFPFLVYPKETGGALAELFERAQVALYDPEGSAAPALAVLGLHADRIGAFEELARYPGGLIIVGPGGFSRGREALGPILAARARSGARILLLEQPSLPGTLSADLRLWPFPETLGDDMCTGKTKSLPGVVFVFATCAKANKGEPVKRIDVSLPAK